MITATRYHDFCAGHRVAGHENKCAQLHGHNYRIYFTCQMQSPEVGVQLAHHLIGDTTSELDPLGRVIDFAVIKSKLCDWLELNWDHRMLLWEEDPWVINVTHEDGEEHAKRITDGEPIEGELKDFTLKVLRFDPGVIYVPFNPTAENMAKYLVEKVGPQQLEGTGVVLIKVVVEETRKCSATYELASCIEQSYGGF